MARLPRFFVPDTPQHVIQRGNDRQPIFRTLRRPRVLQGLPGVRGASAWCRHSRLRPHDEPRPPAGHAGDCHEPASRHAVGRPRVRPVFQLDAGTQRNALGGRYKATIVDSDRYLLACMRYIELNPVRAGMVEHPNAIRGRAIARMHSACRTRSSRAHSLYRALGAVTGDTPSGLSRAVRPTDCRRRDARDSRRHAERVGVGQCRVSPPTSNASADAPERASTSGRPDRSRGQPRTG